MTLDHPGDPNWDEPTDVDAAFAELIADWHVDTTKAIKDAQRSLSREDAQWRARLQPEPAEFSPSDADDPTDWPEEHYEPPAPPPFPRLHGRTVLAICILAVSITLIVLGSTLGLPFAFSLALGVAGVLTSTGLLITRLRTNTDEDDDGAIV